MDLGLINIISTVTAAVGIIITLILWYFHKKFKHWENCGIVYVKPKFPFGNFKDVFLSKKSVSKNLEDIYNELKKTRERFGGAYFLAGAVFIPLDPELIKHVLTKDFQYFPNRIIQFSSKQDPLSRHLISLKDLPWKNLRNKLTPTFTSGKMKLMFETMLACGDHLREAMNAKTDSREPVDIKDILARFTTDIIGSCAFGIECNSQKNSDSEFRKFGKRVFERSLLDNLKLNFAIIFPKWQDFFGVRVIPKEVNDFYMALVGETVKYREDNNISRNDFLQILLDVKKEEDDEDDNEYNKLTIEQIAAQCFIFFIAGFETSSSTMTFCLYELAIHSDIQEKLREEILNSIEKHEGKISYDSLMEMKHLDNVISEALRKYPPASIIMRSCAKDYQIPDSTSTLRKGDNILISVSALHWDPDNFPDPEKFDPDRFAKENVSKRHPYAYLPFGEGPRSCIGSRFGLMQIKTGLAILLSNFRLSINSKTSVPLVMNPKSLIQAALGDVWLDVERI